MDEELLWIQLQIQHIPDLKELLFQWRRQMTKGSEEKRKALLLLPRMPKGRKSEEKKAHWPLLS